MLLNELKVILGQHGWKFYLVLFISLILKIFYLVYNRGVIGPDATEYIAASDLFRTEGFGYLTSSSPYTFWRLPVFPLLIAIMHSLIGVYVFQSLLTYIISYHIFLIFIKLDFDKSTSLMIGLFTLFVPYLNIAACSPGVEFLQVFLMVYITKKVLYDEVDYKMALGLSLLCLARPEGFILTFLLLFRYLYLKKFRLLVWFVIPISCLLLWQFRNFEVFNSFTLVNPIHSARATIGSIYGAIYVESPHPFHQQHDYHNGFDYVNRKEFIKEYKELAKNELVTYVKNNPIGFLKHRLYWIGKCFSYFSFTGEHLPDQNLHFSSTTDREEILKVNSEWAYNVLWSKKDYFRLLIRGLYNGGLALGNFVGLAFILLNFKRFGTIIFLFLNFSYLFIVEADMRYFIFIQLFCLSVAFYLLINSIFSFIKSQYQPKTNHL